MAFALVPEWSATPSENAAQTGIPMYEGMEPADVNDSIRTIMAAARLMYDSLHSPDFSPLDLKYLKIDFTNLDVAALKVLLGLGTTTSSTFETGDTKPTFRTTASSGWLMLDGSTIGSATSGAGHADATLYTDLFTLLWTNCDNSVLAIKDSFGVAATRGASAAADFAANKRMPLFDTRGRFLRGYDASAGLDPGRVLGSAQTDAIQGHYHSPLGTTTGGSQYGFNVWSTSTGNGHGAPTGTGSNPEATTGAAVTDGTNGEPRTATETRPTNIACNYMIKT